MWINKSKYQWMIKKILHVFTQINENMYNKHVYWEYLTSRYKSKLVLFSHSKPIYLFSIAFWCWFCFHTEVEIYISVDVIVQWRWNVGDTRAALICLLFSTHPLARTSPIIRSLCGFFIHVAMTQFHWLL